MATVNKDAEIRATEVLTQEFAHAIRRVSCNNYVTANSVHAALASNLVDLYNKLELTDASIEEHIVIFSGMVTRMSKNFRKHKNASTPKKALILPSDGKFFWTS